MKYRKVLFMNPKYSISNIANHLGEVKVGHKAALSALAEIENNIFRLQQTFIENQEMVEGARAILDPLQYPMQRIRAHIESGSPVFSDRDTCIFAHHILHECEDLVAIADEIDSKNSQEA
jgi:hypothetical protein